MNGFYYIVFVTGLSLVFSYDDLSEKKKVFQSQTHPGDNYYAMNAVDRVVGTCTRTLEIGRSAKDKTVWWKVDLGGVYNIYSINILYKNYDGYEDRQRGRFAGFSLFVSNTDVSTAADIKASTLCYKDGLLLPPLNFTAICTKRGRYVIFYNERLDNVNYPDKFETNLVFTELCEVIVQGCKTPDMYGSKCNFPCPLNCKDNACDIQNGTCFGCKPGWTGLSCDSKCDEGWYGVKCSQQCVGHCRDDNTCNHVTGLCDGGCDAGWTGSSCNKACLQSYGENCRHPCSPNCYNQSCDRFNGRCHFSCTGGFHGELCNERHIMPNQNESSSNSWIIGFIVSLFINFVFISGVCLLCRGIYTKKVSIPRDLVSCSKMSVYYTDSGVKTSENSTYQELDLSREEIQYQNTTIR